MRALMLLPLLALLTLAACNTTAGLGRDVSATGDAVTNSAEKHSP